MITQISLLFLSIYFSFKQALSASSQTTYSRLSGYSLATTSLPIWIYVPDSKSEVIRICPPGASATFLRSCFISSVIKAGVALIFSFLVDTSPFISLMNLSLASSQIISSLSEISNSDSNSRLNWLRRSFTSERSPSNLIAMQSLPITPFIPEKSKPGRRSEVALALSTHAAPISFKLTGLS